MQVNNLLTQQLAGLSPCSMGIDFSQTGVADGSSSSQSPPNVTAIHTLFMAPINHHQLNQSLQLPGLSLLSRMGSFDESLRASTPSPVDARAPSSFVPSAFDTAPMIFRMAGSTDSADVSPLHARSYSPFYPVTSTESDVGGCDLLPSIHNYFHNGGNRSLKRKRGQMDVYLKEYVNNMGDSPGKKFNISGLASLSQEECVGKILRTSSDDAEDDVAVIEAVVSTGIENRCSGAASDMEDGAASPSRSVDETMTDVCSSDDEELNGAGTLHKEKNPASFSTREVDDWGLTIPKVRLSPFLEAVSTQLLKSVSDDLLPSECSARNTLEEKYRKLKLKHEKLSYMYSKELLRGKKLGLQMITTTAI